MNKILWLMLSLCVTQVSLASDIVNCSPTAHRRDIMQSVKWYRDSAEQKAAYHQVFNTGSDYIKNWVSTHHPRQKTWGVVLDIDETTLDNSWYFYQCSDLVDNESDFEHFVTIPQRSTALPGVVKLTHFVHKLGGYVSLVSNRDGSYFDKTGSGLASTLANLKKVGVYYDQVVLANYKNALHPKDKNLRFNAVIRGQYDDHQMVWSNKLPAHQVIAFFGDNIQDFPQFKQSVIYALPNDANQFNLLGHGYFLVPNPMYGSWEANKLR